jgi:hypothetical protein
MPDRPMHFQVHPPALMTGCGRIVEQAVQTTDHRAVTCRQCRYSTAYRRTLPRLEGPSDRGTGAANPDAIIVPGGPNG